MHPCTATVLSVLNVYANLFTYFLIEKRNAFLLMVILVSKVFLWTEIERDRER